MACRDCARSQLAWQTQLARCGLIAPFFFFKQKTAYEMVMSDWSSDVCSSDLRSVTEFSTPHQFKLTWVYETPIGKGKRFDFGKTGNALIGGWQLAGIHGYQSGLPIQVSYSGYTIPAGFAPGIRPDVLSSNQTVGGAPSKTDFSTPVPYLNPKAFAVQ